MLKIIDSAELNILEKFGFERNHRTNIYEYRSRTSWEVLGIQPRNRCIYFELEKANIGGMIVEDILSVLFDLIQAGLIEKVEE